jgi:RNA polymerase sigma-70 factor (ECF subfamily)
VREKLKGVAPPPQVIQPSSDDGYRDFYRRELPAMVALAAAVSGTHLGAEDIAQEALIRAYRRWPTVSGYERPGAWLRRVTINLALSGRRKTASELRTRLRLVNERAPSAGLAPAPVEHDDVWGAVSRLPGNQRAAVALHYLEDRPVAEIAEILDCAENTAKVHLHRGRAALADLLEGIR